jgi:hypothetical protein
MVAVAVGRRSPMWHGPEPNEEGGDTGSPAAPVHQPISCVRWYRRNTGWWKGLRIVLSVLSSAVSLNQDEALAIVARALIAVGDMIVDAGEHKRS